MTWNGCCGSRAIANLPPSWPGGTSSATWPRQRARRQRSRVRPLIYLIRFVTRVLYSLERNRAITVAAQNRRLALIINILSPDSNGAVQVPGWDIKADSG